MLARIADPWARLSILLAEFFAGAVIAVPIILWLITWQRRRAVGQHVYEDAPSSHAVKQGTPTMGGLAFAAAAIIGTLLFSDTMFIRENALLLLVLCAAAIGFADDYLKVVRHRALGLRARAKFALLLVVACAFVAWEMHPWLHAPGGQFSLGAQAWFNKPTAAAGWVLLPLWLWGVLAVGAIVGAANAVNLTDGLDGLAAGTVLPPLLMLSSVRVSALGFAVAGACAAFLFFNRHPARIFMGDTGSLSLGALLGGLAVQAHMLLILPLVGIVFVAEALSVILQVISFKTTGRRIFKMTPLHHHFEMSGWSEMRVTTTFIVVSCFATAVASLGLLIANPWLWSFTRGSIH